MNRKYIGVVAKKDNGDLEFKREEISKDYEDLKMNIINMYNNPNRTLLDLQTEFSRFFTNREYYHVCLPYTYNSSYVDGIGTPQTKTYDEYQNLLAAQKKLIEEEYNGLIKKYGNILGEKEDYINNKLEEYKKELKRPYCNECTRFIDAYNFNQTYELIKRRENTKMLSTEDIGWTTYEYKVNDDVVITVHTNFGYGFASYFFLEMKYKGIQILPYTAYIYYYNANVVEIKRHTRQYSTSDRDSWNLALSFVVEAANLAKNNSQEFINKWIFNEVKEMYEGLVNYMNNPDTELQNFINNGNTILNGFCRIYAGDILTEDARWFNLLRNEMSIVFKAEKITGALSFLDKLKELNPYFPQIQTYIDGINNLNVSLSPEVETMMTKIQSDVDRITKQLELEERYLAELNENVRPYDEKLNEILKGKNAEEIKTQKQLFKDENPECVELKKKQEEQESKVNQLRSDKMGRVNLYNRLEVCLGRIESHFAA